MSIADAGNGVGVGMVDVSMGERAIWLVAATHGDIAAGDENQVTIERPVHDVAPTIDRCLETEVRTIGGERRRGWEELGGRTGNVTLNAIEIGDRFAVSRSAT